MAAEPTLHSFRGGPLSSFCWLLECIVLATALRHVALLGQVAPLQIKARLRLRHLQPWPHSLLG